MNLFQKQPADQLDYDLDFSDWITPDDTITGAVAVSSAPDQLIVVAVSVASPVVKVWCAGGLSGTTYKVTATITTAKGRVKELEFRIRVKDF